MRRLVVLTAAAVLAVPSTRADQPTPAEQFSKLVAEYDDIQPTFMKEYQADKSQAATRAALDKRTKAYQAWREKALALIRQHPAEANAIPVIEKYVSGENPDTAVFVEVLRKHHMADPRLSKLISPLYRSTDAASRKFALEIADTHPDRAARGRATYAVGRTARLQLLRIEMPLGRTPRTSDDQQAELRSHAETYLGKALKEYADVELERGNGLIGPVAKAELAGLPNLGKLKVGKPVPEIEGVDLEGAKLKLSDHRGQVVLVVFWASWCGPCMGDVPHEREIVEKLKGRPFVLVGVNGDRELAKAKGAVEKAKISWRSFAPDETGPEGGIPASWNVYAWPTTYVIDHTGVIRHVNLRGARLDKPLEELVAAAEVARKAGGQ
jgi:thiol-disulfide isomerase/thioredoxin